MAWEAWISYVVASFTTNISSTQHADMRIHTRIVSCYFAFKLTIRYRKPVTCVLLEDLLWLSIYEHTFNVWFMLKSLGLHSGLAHKGNIFVWHSLAAKSHNDLIAITS